MGPKEKGFWARWTKTTSSANLYDMQIRRWEPTSGSAKPVSTPAHPTWRPLRPEPGTFDFAIMKIGTGFYKIVPVDPLVPGEYCTGLHRLPTDVERLYCFGVDSPADREWGRFDNRPVSRSHRRGIPIRNFQHPTFPPSAIRFHHRPAITIG